MNDQLTPDQPAEASAERQLWRPFAIGAVAVAALAGTLGAVSVANAQSSEAPEPVVASTPAAVEVPDLNEDAETDGVVDEMDFEVSPDDEAVFDQFDQCLADNGLTEDLWDLEEWTAEEEIAADAAFETCDPILENLSDELKAIEAGFDDMGFEISPEDEAIFDQFDQCLVDNGLALDDGDEDLDIELTDEQETVIDAAFEACEPILDGLSEEFLAAEDSLESCDEDHEDADEEA